ncbi:Uncharacterised protein [uncultured archaeon]|nr:Uncharacterised protein [uncultured archaeon]
MSEPYDTLNSRWASTCKVIFGQELGELSHYSNYLESRSRPPAKQKSCLSGKEVALVSTGAHECGSFQSLGEVDWKKTYAPLPLDQLKDIDSILSALGERFIYTGDIVLGKSAHVQSSSDVIDSHYVLESTQISFSKYIAYSYCLEYGDCIFGSQNHGHCSYCIGISNNDKNVRCLEVSHSSYVNDCAYCHNIHECNDCLFSFGLRSSRYCIGNLQLPKDKYVALKKALMEQMAHELQDKRTLPRLEERIASLSFDRAKTQALLSRAPPAAAKPWNPKPVEESFSKTMSILLGRPLSPIAPYGPWLSQTARAIYHYPSLRPGASIGLPDYAAFSFYPHDRLVGEADALFLGRETRMTEPSATPSFESMFKAVSDAAFFCSDYFVGKNFNNHLDFIGVDCSNMLQSVVHVTSKNCAYGYYYLESESCFGCHAIRDSKFCANCCLSAHLSRCLECHSCNSSTDCYFCHNVENCEECLFCFNVKGKRYAIGNVEMKKEDYLRIKKTVLAELAARLEKDKTLPLSIFNLGCKP